MTEQETIIISTIDYDAIRALAPQYEDRIREAAEKAAAAEDAKTNWNITSEMKALVAIFDEAQDFAMAQG